MKKTLMGLLALGMSAIMSVSALAAGSVKGTELVAASVDDGFAVEISASTKYDVVGKSVTDAFADLIIDSNATDADLTKLVAVEGAYDVVVKDGAGDVAEYDKAATLEVNYPKMTSGNTYYLVFGDAADGLHLAKVEGTVGEAATSSNGAVLADMTVPTVDGQTVTMNFSSLKDAVFCLYYVQNGTGDVNPVIPVLAAVVVVSAAGIVVFKKRRA